MTHDYKFTGEVDGEIYIYSCVCGQTIALMHADENITTKPVEPVIYDTEMEHEQGTLIKKKSQSDYHKQRYQLIKAGMWVGSMTKNP